MDRYFVDDSDWNLESDLSSDSTMECSDIVEKVRSSEIVLAVNQDADSMNLANAAACRNDLSRLSLLPMDTSEQRHA